jgi:hypothetical protein
MQRRSQLCSMSRQVILLDCSKLWKIMYVPPLKIRGLVAMCLLSVPFDHLKFLNIYNMILVAALFAKH